MTTDGVPGLPTAPVHRQEPVKIATKHRRKTNPEAVQITILITAVTAAVITAVITAVTAAVITAVIMAALLAELPIPILTIQPLRRPLHANPPASPLTPVRRAITAIPKMSRKLWGTDGAPGLQQNRLLQKKKGS